MTRLQSPPEAVALPPLIVIGASAGGITALQQLFEALGAGLPFAFVVLQHLPPGSPSGLSGLLRNWTAMPVETATDDTRPQPGAIHLPSPDAILTLEDQRFRTRPAEGGQRRPGTDAIDAFLESLSPQEAARTVTVILSGSGMDGTAGAIHIRQCGGTVIVQDPRTAAYESMPNAIAQRGLHHLALPVEEIARYLRDCAAPDHAWPTATPQSTPLGDTLKQILELIRRQAAFDFSGYKTSPLLWRIQQRMEVRRVWAFADYAALLEDDPAELVALVKGIPVHVTEFFRDPEAWEALAEEVLLPLLAQTDAEPLRIWIPACSTGQEAYSMAMLLDELRSAHGGTREAQLFATEPAPEMLARASRGLYRGTELTTLSPARRESFFYAVDGGWRVKRTLRERMVFAIQDLLLDPPLASMDLISCRNLLIYLEPETIDQVLQVLHGALRPGGYLLLGRSEAYPLHRRGFEPLSLRWNLHRKAGALPEQRPLSPRGLPSRATRAAEAERKALEQFKLPSALIDVEGQVLRLYGNTEGFLGLPAGEPSYRLLDLVPRPWVAHLRHHLTRALHGGRPSLIAGLPDRFDPQLSVTLRLTPLDGPGQHDQVLVSFIRQAGAGDSAALAAHPGATLPVEEADWREAIRLSQEELEASREELQALNEELKALNDELKDANEHLQLSNEDLNQANDSLQGHIEQLQMQRRVLSSGAVMTLCLDAALRIRWFTPAMSELLPLRQADTGRQVQDLVPRFQDPALFDDIRQVLADGESRTAVVASQDGRWFLRRICPDPGDAQPLIGVALTFADVTLRTQAELTLRERERQLKRNQQWLTAQKEAFQSAMKGDDLCQSLGILVRALIAEAGDQRRCAFFLSRRTGLSHVVGMAEGYAREIEGFLISPDSFACGLAIALGIPVITRDVLEEPRWASYAWLARQYDFRGCWSFPVKTAEGESLGSLAMYFEHPQLPDAVDLELAAAFTHTAAIIIWRHLQVESAPALAATLSCPPGG